jgi:transposase
MMIIGLDYDSSFQQIAFVNQDPAQIKATRVRKEKNDRHDARLLLQLLAGNRFAQVWVPSVENRDLRPLLWHRHRLVQMRTRIMNQLQAVAMNEGVRRKKGLWSKSGGAQLDAFLPAPGPSGAARIYSNCSTDSTLRSRSSAPPSSRRPRNKLRWYG